MLRDLIRSAIHKLGYRIHKSTAPPYGVSAVADIVRYSPDTIKTLIDVGANTGQTVKEFCAVIPGLSVYAFEPVSPTYDQLVVNTRTFRAVNCFRMALGASRGTATIFLKSDSQQNSLNPMLNTPTSASEVVQVETLDHIVREYHLGRVDVLKTDTENFDLEVLAGATHTLQAGMVSFILAEIGFSEDDKFHTNLTELMAVAHTNGFDLMGVYERLYHHIRPRVRSWANALFIHRALLAEDVK